MNVLWRRSHLIYCLNRALTKELTVIPHYGVYSLYSTLRTTSALTNLIPSNLSYNTIRCKSKKHKEDDSDDENSEIFDDDSSLTKDSKVVKINATTLRTDAILKSALGVARNKIEKLFYESKIRVNGRKIMKKSIPVQVEYEIDVIKGVSPKNPDHLYVSRVEILSIVAKEESITITARRFKNLLIENYQYDPYKPSTADEDN